MSKYSCYFSLLTFAFVFFQFSALCQNQIVWGPTQDVSSSTFGSNRPRIVTDASNNPVIIWGNSGNLMLSRWNGGAFTLPVQLNPPNIQIAEANWMGPDMESHGDTIYIVVKQTPEYDSSSHVWCLTSYDGGNSFLNIRKVDNIADSLSKFPTVTTDAAGNPIVGFMKFDANFGDARWVVSRSNDHGISFGTDLLASEWSGSSSVPCECCSGNITSSGNSVAMIYRDNNNNIRDNWVGISNNAGASFTGGVNLDQLNWLFMSCPTSGPDGKIIGDTLYAVTMSGVTGTARIYLSKTSVSQMTRVSGTLLTPNITPFVGQNIGRIANSGKSIAIVWRQTINGKSELPIIFSDDISKGISGTYDTIASDYVSNADIAMTANNIYVAWQDWNSGTVKFRSGTISTASSVDHYNRSNDILLYPNPTSGIVNIRSKDEVMELYVYNSLGTEVERQLFSSGKFGSEINLTEYSNGLYLIKVITSEDKVFVKKILR